MTRNKTPLSTPTFSRQAAKAVASAQCITYVTNWPGGRHRAGSEEGYGSLVYPDLAVVARHIRAAVDTGEPLDATIIIQDFQLFPELTVARQKVRNDEKYFERSLTQRVEFAAKEISGSMYVYDDLVQYAALSKDVRFELRATTNQVTAPVVYSENGLVVGSQPPNLSDSYAPNYWHEPGSELYDFYVDGCDVHKRDSIQIIGDAPDDRAGGFLKLGMDEAALVDHFVWRVTNDFFRYPRSFVNRSEIIDPQF